VLVSRAVGPGAHFATFARATVAAAAGLHGPGSREMAAVAEAWAEVGVL
jgi:Zn-dependent metalloprotease